MRKLFVILSIVLLCGCGNSKVEDSKRILDSIITEGNYIIVDVRTDSEYKEGHVKDAINIPYDEIDEAVELDKSKTILVYCKSGGRSSVAAKTLESLGYDVYDMGAYSSVTLDKE